MRKLEEILTVNQLIEKYLPQISQQFIRYHLNRRCENGLYKCCLTHNGKIYLKKDCAILWFKEHEENKKNRMFIRD